MTSKICLLLAVSVGLPAAEDPWRFVDPGSKLIMGIRMRRILDSPIGQQMRQQMRDAMPAAIPFLPGGASSLLSNIDTVLLASPGPAANKPGSQPPTLIVVTGQFDLAKLRSGIHQKTRRAVVQNVEIFESPGKGPDRMAIALVNPELLLLGDTASVVRVIGSTAPMGSTALMRARQMDQDYDFWMMSSIPPDSLAQSPVPLPLPSAHVEGVEFGIQFTQDVGMEMSLQMASAEEAEKARAQLAKTIHLAGKDRNNPQWAGAEKYFKMGTEGNTLSLTFRITAADLEKRIATSQARRKAAPAATPAAVVPAPRPLNSKPVIWNADPGQNH